MKRINSFSVQLFSGLLLLLTMALPQFVQAQIPVLGTYSNTTVVAGGQATVTPSAAPTNTASIVAYTNTNYDGVFHVNPTSGVVTVTNALQVGTYPVTVKAFNAGGSLTATATFSLTVSHASCNAGVFTNAANVIAGTQPLSAAIGDFNNDAKQDIAVANFQTNNVSIRLGNGSGGFTGSTNLAVGINPFNAAVCDVNGDGNQDLLVTNQGSNTVSVLLGNGSGGFSVSSTVPVGLLVTHVSVGDFNGDGKQDFLTANQNAGTISVRMGDGLGGFSGTTNVTVGGQPHFVAIGDFNNDGKQDFAAVKFGTNDVSIRLGDGLGGFSGSTNVAVGALPRSIAIGDFNGDGNQDFATPSQTGNNITIRLGNGSGGFTGSTNIATGTFPWSIEVADFNADGKQDLAVAHSSATTVAILLGNGTGGFTPTTNVTIGTGATYVSIGDFNGDGKHDFATANSGSNTISVRLGGDQEINVQGNSVSITDGDVTPSLTDHTEFGVVNVGGSIVRTFTIQNTGTANLTIGAGAITMTGSDAAMFTVGGITLPATVAPASSATFTVTFTPSSAGTKNATVNIVSNDCDETTYDFAVRGNPCGISTCVGKTLTFTPANSGVSYAWTFGDGGTSTASTPTHAYTAAGGYLVTLNLTDANGCVTTATEGVCVYDAPTVTSVNTNPLCNGATNGSINVSVTGGAPGTTFTYLWSNGATTQDLSNVGAGTYIVTVTDGTSTCFTTLSVTLTQPAVLAATETHVNVLCFGSATGSIDLSVTGGTTAYTYLWSNSATTQDVSGLAAGTYSVTVTDANGCTTTASATIGQPAAPLAANETHVNVLCFGNSTGSIDLSVTGGTSGYTYLWSNGATTQDLSGLAAGTYGVTVTDANGCTTTASVVITQPASALAVAPSNSGNVCSGLSTANVLSNASGGTPIYTYLWTPGNLTTQNLSNVGAGTYNVTVTDANGCTATGSTTVGTFPGTPATFIITH